MAWLAVATRLVGGAQEGTRESALDKALGQVAALRACRDGRPQGGEGTTAGRPSCQLGRKDQEKMGATRRTHRTRAATAARWQQALVERLMQAVSVLLMMLPAPPCPPGGRRVGNAARRDSTAPSVRDAGPERPEVKHHGEDVPSEGVELSDGLVPIGVTLSAGCGAVLCWLCPAPCSALAAAAC